MLAIISQGFLRHFTDISLNFGRKCEMINFRRRNFFFRVLMSGMRFMTQINVEKMTSMVSQLFFCSHSLFRNLGCVMKLIVSRNSRKFAIFYMPFTKTKSSSRQLISSHISNFWRVNSHSLGNLHFLTWKNFLQWVTSTANFFWELVSFRKKGKDLFLLGVP